jgi:hypothetical protein
MSYNPMGVGSRIGGVDGRRRGAGGSKNYSVYQPNTPSRNPSSSLDANGKPAAPVKTREQEFKNPTNPNTPQGGKGGFKPNAVGGYVAPEQTYTGHTSSVKGSDGYYGTGGGMRNPVQQRPDATSIIARPDLQKANAPTQLDTAAPSNFAARTPLTNRNMPKVAPVAPKAMQSNGKAGATPAGSGQPKVVPNSYGAPAPVVAPTAAPTGVK